MMIQAVRENVGLEYHRIAMEGELHLTKSEDGDIQLDLSFKLEEAHLMYERTTYSTKLALPGMYEKLKTVKFPEFPTQAEAPEWKKMLEEAKKIVQEFIEMLKAILGEDEERKKTDMARLVAQARRAIQPGGYWSPEKTAKRILKFARSISNNDVSKIDLLKDAVKKAFEEIQEKLGSPLPEILQETYQLVMKGFEEWKEEMAPGEMVA